MASRVRPRWRVGPVGLRKLLRAYRYLATARLLMALRSRRVSNWMIDGQDVPIQSAPGAATIAGPQRHRIVEAAYWTDIASRHPWQWARCLQRSTAMCLWLEREGMTPRLVIGVRRTDQGIRGHAWVEYGGEIVNDLPEVRSEFATLRQPGFTRLDSVARWEEGRKNGE